METATKNEIGMYLACGQHGWEYRWDGPRKGYHAEASPKERAIREKWQREVAATSCCAAAFMVEAVTLSERLITMFHVPYRCPNRCPAWQAMNGVEEL